MDRDEFITFILISIAIFAGWYFIAVPMLELDQAPQQKQGDQSTSKQAEPRGDQQPTTPAEEQKQDEKPGEESPGEEPELQPVEGEKPGSEDAAEDKEGGKKIEVTRDLTLENEDIRTTWTNQGAGIVKSVLKKYKASDGEEGERADLTLLKDFQKGRYGEVLESVVIASGGVSEKYTTADLVYRVAEKGERRIVFRGLIGDKLEVRKALSIPESGYHVEVDYTFYNRTDKPMNLQYNLRGASGIVREKSESQYLGIRVGLRTGDEYDTTFYGPGDMPATNESAGLTWGAVVSHYFAAVTLPDDDDWIKELRCRPVTPTRLKQGEGRWEDMGGRGASAARGYPAPEVVLVSAETELSAGGTLTRAHRFVMTPKDEEVLKGYGAGLTQLIYFGWIPFLSRFMLGVLRWFHYLIPNYGVAIILLTLVVRGGLHPLTRKSQVSMAKMRKLQPKIQELQDKYDDRQKLGREQMKLYSKYGVSPMSGCLPLLLQLPIFVSLYGALRAAIELRLAGFLWIQDLSRPDTLFQLPVDLPLFGSEFHLLPFLAAGAMYMNQKLMQTSSGDNPQAQMQQTMMKFMPVFLLFVFYNLPSGLTLYITTSMGLGMVQQWLVRRHVADLKLKPVDEEDSSGGSGETRADSGKKGQSGLFGRFMEWVERQQKESQQLGGGDNK